MGKTLGVENDKIIHEHLKCLDVKLILKKVNQNRHVEISRKLRNQLANGDANARRIEHERLVAWQAMPKRRRRAANEVLLRSIVDSLLEKVEKKVAVGCVIVGHDEVFVHPPKNILVDRHEETLNVEADDDRIFSVVIGERAELGRKRLHGTEATITLAAVFGDIALPIKPCLKQWLYTLGNPVMNDTVTVIRAEDLTLDRVRHDENV